MAEISSLLGLITDDQTRQALIAQMENMFDNAPDEERLIQEIGNPTKVAVALIRYADSGKITPAAAPVVAPAQAQLAGLLGSLFVGALKAVAPVLVFILVAASIASHQHGQKTSIRPLLILYLFGTFCAAVVGVVASFAFPSELQLATNTADITPPSGISEVLGTLLFSVVKIGRAHV